MRSSMLVMTEGDDSLGAHREQVARFAIDGQLDEAVPRPDVFVSHSVRHDQFHFAPPYRSLHPYCFSHKGME